MSTVDILAELPRLSADERRRLMRRLCELQEADLLHGIGPDEEEKRQLDEALAEFQRDGNPGTPWRQVLERISSANR